MSIDSELKRAYDDVISVFYEIAHDMNSTFDKKEMIDLALSLLKKVVDYKAISFVEYSEKNDMYMILKNQNYDHQLKKAFNEMVREGLLKWAGKLGKPFVNPEVIGEIKTTVIVPLIYKEELKGAIVVHTDKTEEYFDQNRLKVLSIISDQLIVGFQNLYLYIDIEKRNNKLKSLKNYMENVVTGIGNGIMVADMDDTIRVLNKKASELLRIKAKRFISKEKISGNKIAEFKDLMLFKSRTLSGEDLVDEELEILHDDGEITPLGVSTTLLTDGEKNTGIIFVLRDLSESKELKELKRVDKLKDEFLSMVSHELRTPLTSIKAYTETLLYMVMDMEEFEDKEDQLNFLNIINEESERLTRLINDVLDLSKIEAGKMSFFMENESADAILERAMANMKGFSESKNTELILKNEVVGETIFIDKDRILQVFNNLVNNAIKFTPKNGIISINAKIEDENFISIEIKDNGAGVKDEDKLKIFDKFSQSEDILTREAGGTGLGLPICKNIVEHFGGKIWVESVYGEGASFYFTVPRVSNENGGSENE